MVSSSSQKQMVGGLSSLFSSQPARRVTSSSFCTGGGEESGSLWHDRGDELKELSSSFCYSLGKFGVSFSKRDQSLLSVFQGPVSCDTSCSRSSPLRPGRERLGIWVFRAQSEVGLMVCSVEFVTNALGSCVDYDSPSSEALGASHEAGPSSMVMDELTFNMEDFMLLLCF